MGTHRRGIVSVALIIGLIAPLTPALAASAAASTRGGVSDDIVDDVRSATEHPDIEVDDASVRAGRAPSRPGAPDAPDDPLVGLTQSEVEDRLEDQNEASVEESPDVSYTTQSRDVRNDDGTHTIEIYPEPAFAPDEDGNWKRLSPTVEESDERGAAAEAADTLAPVTFGDDADDLLTFEVGGGEVTASAPDLAIGDPKVDGNTVTYEDVAPGVDLEYVVGTTTVKEKLIIGSADAPRSYTSFLADSDGQLGTVSPDGQGGWSFSGPEGEDDAIVLRIPAALAYEVGDEATIAHPLAPKEESARVTVTPADGGFDVVTTLDDDWAAGHEFPIVLDPTFSWAWGHPHSGTTGNGPQNGGLDGYAAAGGSLVTGDPFLYAGTNTANGAQGVRSFLRFPYAMEDATYRSSATEAPFPVNLPLRADVQFAGIWLRYAYCVSFDIVNPGQPCPGGSPTAGIDLYNMTGTWGTGSTYTALAAAMAAQPENQNPATVRTGASVPNTSANWQTVNNGGQYSALSYYPPPPNPWFSNTDSTGYDPNAWQLVMATDTVRDWVNDPATAYGLALKSRSETPAGGSTGVGSIWFSSNGHPQLTEPQKVFPLLSVIWSPTPAGPAGNLTQTVTPDTLLTSKVTASFDQPTTGTYATSYIPVLFEAATGLGVGSCPTVATPYQPASFTPTTRISCEFNASVLPGEYYWGVQANNEGGSTWTYSSKFRVGLAIDPDGTALGYEPWWTYESRPVGPGATASVNVSNGNLVVQQNDGTPVQGHGQLAYVLRRTYNSQAPTAIGLTSSGVAQGWTFNVTTAGDLGAPLAAGLTLPLDLTALVPGNVTMVDRDGTRHLYTPSTTTVALPGLGGLTGLLSGSAKGVNDLLGLAQQALPVSVGLPTNVQLSSTNSSICIDTTYKPPAGVHVALWRYIAVDLGDSSCVGTPQNPITGPLGLASPIAVGYGTMTPDRTQQFFALTGQLVSQFDSRGNELRYVYEYGNAALPGVQLGRLKYVYEPANCGLAANTDPLGFFSINPTSTCRRFKFDYELSKTKVTDPAGRVTTYTITGGVLGTGQLTQADTLDAAGNTIARWNYSYCGTPQRLCGITDPQGSVMGTAGHTTTIDYVAGAPGKVEKIHERSDAADATAGLSADDLTTTFTYGTDTTTATRDGRARKFLLDPGGRVTQLQEASSAGIASGDLLARTDFAWDTGCRKPSNLVDNNLCTITRHAGTIDTEGAHPAGWTPPVDHVTKYEYNPEGQVLRMLEGDGTTWLTSTNSYAVQYWAANGTATTVTDANGAAGSRSAVALPIDPIGTPGAPVMFTVSDRTGTTSPAGRTTTYVIANNASVRPGTRATPCASANIGVVCSETRTNGQGQTMTTSYTYDTTFGQRTSMTRPEGQGKCTPSEDQSQSKCQTYQYVYYGEGDPDLSGQVSAGGWLKAVIAPADSPTGKANAVVFAYDRAGNQARAWDRNSTSRLRTGANANLSATSLVALFPGTGASPPIDPTVAGGTTPLPYAESLYGGTLTASSFGQPQNFLRASRNQVGSLTFYTLDFNGNATRTRPPRGNAANSSAYDVLRTFTPRDQLRTESVPATAGAVHTFGYDAAGHTAWSKDPNGHIQADVYDEANRLVAHEANRGDASSPMPAGDCHLGDSGTDDPFAGGTKVCVTRTSYDGTGQPFRVTQPDGGASWTARDFDGRPVDAYTLRSVAGPTSTWIRSSQRYDTDGNVDRQCPPSQYEHVPTASSATAAQTDLRYSTFHTFDGAGRRTSTVRYREQVNSDAGSSTPFVGWDALTTSVGYDKNSNVVTETRPDGLGTSTTYDALDRATGVGSVRTGTPAIPATWTSEIRTYDPSGNQTSKSLSANDTPGVTITAYTFDAGNRPVDTVEAATSTNPVDQLATNPYVADVHNIRSRNLYDPDGNVVGIYDPQAFYTSVSTPDTKFLTRIDYDASGRPVARWTPYYDTTAGSAYAVAATGGPEQADCPSPRTEHQPAAVAGVPAYAAATGICVTRRTYDGAGNVLTDRNETGSVHPVGDPVGFTAPNRFTQYEYTQGSLVKQVTGPNPAPTNTSHPAEPAAGRVILAQYAYDANGRQLSQTDPAANPSSNNGWTVDTTYLLDGLSSGVTEHVTGSSTVKRATSYAYTANGQVSTETRAVDATTSTTTRTQYFADDTVWQTTQGAGTPGTSESDSLGATTRYARDLNGNPAKVWSPSAIAGPADTTAHNSTPTNPNRLPTTNLFTSDGLLVRSTEPVANDGSMRQTDYKYDRLGNKLEQKPTITGVAAATMPAVNAQTFSYSDNGWVKRETGRGGEAIDHLYWADGTTFATVDSTSATTTVMYPYLNGKPRVSSVTTGSSTPIYNQFRYYGDGLEYARVAWTNSTFTALDTYQVYSYNDARKLTDVYHYGPGHTSPYSRWQMSYDRDGRQVTGIDPALRQTTSAWNAEGTLASQTVTTAAQGQRIQSWTYTYDGLDRQKSQVVESGTSTLVSQSGYHYDRIGRVDGFSSSSTTATANIEYDKNGNRTYFSLGTSTYRPDNSLTQGTFDAAGRQVNLGTAAYAYDGFDRVTCYAASGSSCTPTINNTVYTYDGLDRQTSVKKGTTTTTRRYVGETSTLQAELNSTDATKTARYVDTLSGQPLAAVNAATTPVTQYLNSDGHGSVAMVTNATGSTPSTAKGCSVRYNPWGSPISPINSTSPCATGTTTSFNNIWYRGATRDEQTGTYRMGARTYQPNTATWLTSDTYRAENGQGSPTVGSDPLLANRYSYVNGDPLNLIDPSGHIPIDCLEPGVQCSHSGNGWNVTPEVRPVVKEIGLDDLEDAMEGAGLAADVTSEATKHLRGEKVRIVVVYVGQTRRYIFTDGVSTGIFTAEAGVTIALVQRAPTDLVSFGRSVGRAAGVVSGAVDAYFVMSAFAEGFNEDPDASFPIRVVYGLVSAAPVAVGVAIDSGAASAGVSACAATGVGAIVSGLCGVGAVLLTHMFLGMFQGIGSAPASYCQTPFFNAEQAHNMGFDHTTEEITGCI